MKKSLVWLLLLLFLTACSTGPAQKSKYEIVVVPQMWSEEVNASIEEHVKDRPELNVYQNTAEEPDGLYQALLVEDLMAQEVDAVCIDPVDMEILEPVMEKAEEAGIVVIVGTNIPEMIDLAEKELK